MTRALLLIAAAGSLAACGGEPAPVAEESPAPAAADVAAVPEILERPFTAEQIRDEWVEGLRLRVRRWTSNAEAYENWRVIGSDADGVDIECRLRGRDQSAALSVISPEPLARKHLSQTWSLPCQRSPPTVT